MTPRPFLKMHGLGNDFVVMDARQSPLELSPPALRAIADRHRGVGFDQLVVMRPAVNAEAMAFMSIYNSDGSEVSACGNATRCVGWLLLEESGQDRLVIETKAGLLRVERRGQMLVSVDMGQARLDWSQIPLSQDVDTLALPLERPGLSAPVAVSMGNPHAVFFVDDLAAIDLTQVGPGLEHDPIFPERSNIEFAQVLGADKIRMRVWERGSGITEACGTGACATLVAAARRGLVGRKAEVVLDGGSLFIEWREDGHVIMTGPVAVAFSGQLDPSLLESGQLS